MKTFSAGLLRKNSAWQDQHDNAGPQALEHIAPAQVSQERVGTPSTNTVQAPHWPSPQPYLAPVKSRSSRNTLSSGLSASALTPTLVPLMRSSVTSGILVSSYENSRNPSPDRQGGAEPAPAS